MVAVEISNRVRTGLAGSERGQASGADTDDQQGAKTMRKRSKPGQLMLFNLPPQCECGRCWAEADFAVIVAGRVIAACARHCAQLAKLQPDEWDVWVSSMGDGPEHVAFNLAAARRHFANKVDRSNSSNRKNRQRRTSRRKASKKRESDHVALGTGKAVLRGLRRVDEN